jgi:low affinity Fe/Cu permease
MTDAQIIAIAVTVLAILGGALINNSRIGDVKEVLRAEFRADTGELRSGVKADISELRSGVKADIMQLRMEVNERFNSIDRKLDEILRIVGDHETRITRLEARPH